MLTERAVGTVRVEVASIVRRISCVAVLAALSGCWIGKQHSGLCAHSASEQELESPLAADFESLPTEGYSVLNPDRGIFVGRWTVCRKRKSKISYLDAKKVCETSARVITNECSFFENGTFSFSSEKNREQTSGAWDYSEGCLRLRFENDGDWQTLMPMWKSENCFLLKRFSLPFRCKGGAKVLSCGRTPDATGLLRTDLRWEDENGHRYRVQSLDSPMFYSRKAGCSERRIAPGNARTADKIPGRWSGSGKFASAEYEFYGDGDVHCRKKIGKTEIVWSGKWDYSWEAMSFSKRRADGREERVRLRLAWYSDTEFEFVDDGSGAADNQFILKGAKIGRAHV